MAAYLPLLTVLASGGTAGCRRWCGWRSHSARSVLAFLVSYRWGHHVGRVLGHPEDEQLLLRILGLTLIVAAVAEHLHASAAVGAFLVGLTLTGPIADRARTVLTPLRDLFAAVFFVAIGLTVAPADLLPMLPFALGLAAVTAVTKVITGAYAAHREGAGTARTAACRHRADRPRRILPGDHRSGRSSSVGGTLTPWPPRTSSYWRSSGRCWHAVRQVELAPWHPWHRDADRFRPCRRPGTDRDARWHRPSSGRCGWIRVSAPPGLPSLPGATELRSAGGRRRIHRTVDGTARRRTQPRRHDRADRGRADRLGGIGTQRRLRRRQPHPRRGERKVALARRIRPTPAAGHGQPRRHAGRHRDIRHEGRLGANRHAQRGHRSRIRCDWLREAAADG